MSDGQLIEDIRIMVSKVGNYETAIEKAFNDLRSNRAGLLNVIGSVTE
jgi:hypothetical protein